MSSYLKPFQAGGATVGVAPTTAGTARVAIGVMCSQIRVYNDHTATIFYKVGKDNTVTATASDVPLPTGGLEVASVNPTDTYVAFYIATGTATNYGYVTPGAGI